VQLHILLELEIIQLTADVAEAVAYVSHARLEHH